MAYEVSGYPKHYVRWRNMMLRCYKKTHPRAERYSERGIDVCPEWRDFWVFQNWCLETFEFGKTLDRRNNNEGYSPENCRWATPREQRLNTEKTAKQLATWRRTIKSTPSHRGKNGKA